MWRLSCFSVAEIGLEQHPDIEVSQNIFFEKYLLTEK